MAASPSPEDRMPDRDPRPNRTLPIVLTLVAVLCVGLLGAYASTATLTDEVSLVALEAHGGTLDLAVDESGFGIDANALAAVAPGSTRSATLRVTNTGSVDADLTFVVATGAGTDPAGCFDYRLLDDAGTTLLDTGSLDRAVALPLGELAPGAASAKTFQLVLESRADCAVNGATGTLAASVAAVQTEGDS